jgi:hypothetical protein
MRHPASAYVQGINDLAAPLLLVFLGSIVSSTKTPEFMQPTEGKQTITTAQINAKTTIYHDITESDLLSLSTETFLTVEADVFWCLSKLIDEI